MILQLDYNNIHAPLRCTSPLNLSKSVELTTDNWLKTGTTCGIFAARSQKYLICFADCKVSSGLARHHSTKLWTVGVGPHYLVGTGAGYAGFINAYRDLVQETYASLSAFNYTRSVELRAVAHLLSTQIYGSLGSMWSHLYQHSDVAFGGFQRGIPYIISYDPLGAMSVTGSSSVPENKASTLALWLSGSGMIYTSGPLTSLLRDDLELSAACNHILDAMSLAGMYDVGSGLYYQLCIYQEGQQPLILGGENKEQILKKLDNVLNRK